MTSASALPDIGKGLAREFDPGEVRTRTQAGIKLSYVTARVIQRRLDEVFGWENWWAKFEPVPNADSVVCYLTVRFRDADGNWREVTKSDAGGYAGMADQGDDDKSGFSDALKRAAVMFGIGRYLYRDTPTEATASHPPARADAPSAPDRPAGNERQPSTGRELFAWCKDQEKRHGGRLINYINDWARPKNWPGKMVDWTWDQVSEAYQHAKSEIERVHGDHPPARADATELEPPPDAPCPESGKALFHTLRGFEDETGAGLIDAVRDALAGRRLPTRIAELAGDQLRTAWAIAYPLIQKARDKQAAVRNETPPEQRALARATRAYLTAVDQTGTPITPERIRDYIRDYHKRVFEGEFDPSDITRMVEMTAAIEKDTAEAKADAEIPF